MTVPAIAVRGLVKRYGEREVLHGLDFDVYRGEVFCMLGPNGAGKTTTVEVLEGFRDATSGSVRVLGFDPATQPRPLRERVGIVLQECGFPRHVRVGELLDAWRVYYPRPRPLNELLDLVELTDEKTMLVKQISGGQRRRLDFALALAGDPELIFLDEPTTGFDPEARRRCWTAIENLRSLGKTILLTTHYLDEAEHLSDRVAILAEGRIPMVGSTRALAARTRAPTRISFTTPKAVTRGELCLPDELDATINSNEVVVLARDASVTVQTILSWATRSKVDPLENLAVIPPHLEDAYLRLVDENATPLS